MIMINASVNVLCRYHKVGDKYNLVEERLGPFETDDKVISVLLSTVELVFIRT